MAHPFTDGVVSTPFGAIEVGPDPVRGLGAEQAALDGGAIRSIRDSKRPLITPLFHHVLGQIRAQAGVDQFVEIAFGQLVRVQKAAVVILLRPVQPPEIPRIGPGGFRGS